MLKLSIISKSLTVFLINCNLETLCIACNEGRNEFFRRIGARILVLRLLLPVQSRWLLLHTLSIRFQAIWSYQVKMECNYLTLLHLIRATCKFRITERVLCAQFLQNVEFTARTE